MDTRKFGNEISETKNNEKKLCCQQETSLKEPAEFMTTEIEIRCLFLSAMQGLEYFHQHGQHHLNLQLFVLRLVHHLSSFLYLCPF